MAPIAYSYRRFSFSGQARGSSLERQLASTTAYAEKHGLTLDTTLQDPGRSAYTGAHIKQEGAALGAFLEMVRTGRVQRGSYLLIDTMDRLSRQKLTEAAGVLLDLVRAGVRVVTMSDEAVFHEDANLMDLIQAASKMQAAHDYSKMLGDRVAQGHAKRKREAREEGRVWTKSGPRWLCFDPETRRFVAIPERVAVVKRVFRWRVQESLGQTVIAQRLNRGPDAVPTFGGGKDWHGTTISKMLRSRAVLGEYQPRFKDGSPDGEPILGYYGEPIVDPALFYEAQATMDKVAPWSPHFSWKRFANGRSCSSTVFLTRPASKSYSGGVTSTSGMICSLRDGSKRRRAWYSPCLHFRTGTYLRVLITILR